MTPATNGSAPHAPVCTWEELAARDRTIEALMDRVEREFSDTESGQFGLLRQNHLLEGVIRRKTAELDRQREALEAAFATLRRTQGELLENQKLTAIGQLASGVAHEINTPVQYVSDNVTFLSRTFTKLLALIAAWKPIVERESMANPDRSGGATGASVGDDPLVVAARAATRAAKLDYLEREVPSALAQTREGLERVASIVAALKEFAHPSGDSRAPVDLAHLVNTTVTVGRNEWKYVAEVVVDIDVPRFAGVRDRLGQAILNLVVNAAHAIGEVVGPTGERGRGEIRITGRTIGTDVELRVSDTGCGIPPHLISRIFEPFFTTKALGKGTGQGLPLVWSVIVDGHGGSVRVESTPGVGTTFILVLPRAAEEP